MKNTNFVKFVRTNPWFSATLPVAILLIADSYNFTFFGNSEPFFEFVELVFLLAMYRISIILMPDKSKITWSHTIPCIVYLIAIILAFIYTDFNLVFIIGQTIMAMYYCVLTFKYICNR